MCGKDEHIQNSKENLTLYVRVFPLFSVVPLGILPLRGKLAPSFGMNAQTIEFQFCVDRRERGSTSHRRLHRNAILAQFAYRAVRKISEML